MLSHPGPEKITCMKCISCIGSHVSTLWSDVGFYSRHVKNDVTLCILDVNVKNRTAVCGSVDFFKLEWKLFKGKCVTLQQVLHWKTNVVNQKVCKKKYLSWMYGAVRKICHSGSLYGITRQASWCRSVNLVIDFSVHTIHPWKILILHHSLSACSRDNPLVKSRGLSPRTGGQIVV